MVEFAYKVKNRRVMRHTINAKTIYDDIERYTFTDYDMYIDEVKYTENNAEFRDAIEKEMVWDVLNS